jgi:hypothetical protein
VDKITVWKRLDQHGRWEHNHIESGWVEGTPLVKFESQAGWANGKWKHEHKYLKDGVVCSM